MSKLEMMSPENHAIRSHGLAAGDVPARAVVPSSRYFEQHAGLDLRADRAKPETQQRFHNIAQGPTLDRIGWPLRNQLQLRYLHD